MAVANTISVPKLLAGMVTSLAQTVRPAISDMTAGQQVDMACMILMHLAETIDTAVKDVVIENEELETLLKEAADLLLSHDASFSTAVKEITDASCNDLALSALVNRNNQLHEQIFEVLKIADEAGSLLANMKDRLQEQLVQMNQRRHPPLQFL